VFTSSLIFGMKIATSVYQLLLYTILYLSLHTLNLNMNKSLKDIEASLHHETSSPYFPYGYGSIPITFLGGFISIYQLFWCSPGVQGFDPSPYVPSPGHNLGAGAQLFREDLTFLEALAAHPEVLTSRRHFAARDGAKAVAKKFL